MSTQYLEREFGVKNITEEQLDEFVHSLTKGIDNLFHDIFGIAKIEVFDGI